MISSFAHYVSLLRKDFTDYCARRLSEAGLSQGQLYFILYVGRHPDCSPRMLAEALHMDGGHTARSLAKLEQGGFLVQKQDPRDRRAHVLHLTERGDNAFRLSYDLFAQWDNTVLGDFTPEERTQLMALLTRLIHTDASVRQ